MDILRKIDAKFRSRLVYKLTECAYAPDYDIYLEKMGSLLTKGG